MSDNEFSDDYNIGDFDQGPNEEPVIITSQGLDEVRTIISIFPSNRC